MLVITNKRWKNGPNFTPRILAIPTGKKFNLEPKQNFWPYPYRDGWEISDGGWIYQDQQIRDSYGWDENKWYDDVDDGDQENVAGSASQDEQLNAWVYETYREKPWSLVYRDWREGFLRFLELGEAIAEEDLLEPGRYAWLQGHPLSLVLVSSYEHHHEEHLEPLLAWLRNNGA